MCEADGCSRTPPGAMLRQPFRYRRSFMYAAVRAISYIAESVPSWEKESGSVAKLWGSNIRFGYCEIFFPAAYIYYIIIIKSRDDSV